MKKVLSYLAAFIILSSLGFAADQSFLPVDTDHLKINTSKPIKMHARGKVTEISDGHIIIVRRIKDDVKEMEFKLDKPAGNIVVDDYVKINYIERDGKLIALRVIKVVYKKR